MVIKIKKRLKKGPQAPHAVPLVMAMTALYGSRRQGKEFRHPIAEIGKLRATLGDYLGQTVLPADRPLSPSEYLGWGLRATPGQLAKTFSVSGVIPMWPMGSATPEGEPKEEGEGRPRLGLLPLVVLVKAKDLDALATTIGREWPELSRVALQNILYPAFGMIPGYDLLLFLPPCHGRDLNHAIEGLNRLVEDEYRKSGVPLPTRFDPLPEHALAAIPWTEVYRTS